MLEDALRARGNLLLEPLVLGLGVDLLLAVVVDAQQHREEIAVLQREPLLRHRLLQLGFRALACEQLVENHTAQVRPRDFELTRAALLLIPLRRRFLDFFQQHFAVDGLQQIVNGLQVDGLLRIAEILIAREKDEFDIRIFLLGLFGERQPVHERHADIRDHDLWPLLCDDGQRLFPRRRPPRRPVNHALPKGWSGLSLYG